jgi:predicted AAA+ superfamily ATPase
MREDLFPRHLSAELEVALAAARVVNVIGPRQTGKTTLVRDLFHGGRFVTLDNPGTLAALRSDALGQLQALAAEAGDRPVIVDEAQRWKPLALAIKQIVDADRRKGQFILTGSSNVFTTAEVADSMPGRVRTIRMLPLSGSEIHRAAPATLLDWASAAPRLETLPPMPPTSRDQYIDVIIRGGYPEMRDLDGRQRNALYGDYVDAIVDRDVADILKIRKADSMRRLIRQVAARTANELNVATLCSAIGIQRPTAEQYLDILTSLSMIERPGAWASGETGREVKQPKLHMLDTGIVAALRNFSPATFAADANATALGPLVETFTYAELLKNLPYQNERWTLHHWRGRRHEVDFIAESGRTLVAIETKAAVSLDGDDLKNLRWFKREGPGKSWDMTGIVIYLGNDVLSFGDRIFGIPLSVFWAFRR